ILWSLINRLRRFRHGHTRVVIFLAYFNRVIVGKFIFSFILCNVAFNALTINIVAYDRVVQGVRMVMACMLFFHATMPFALGHVLVRVNGRIRATIPRLYSHLAALNYGHSLYPLGICSETWKSM